MEETIERFGQSLTNDRKLVYIVLHLNKIWYILNYIMSSYFYVYPYILGHFIVIERTW